MKSLTATIVVILFLSSSSTVMGMPRAPGFSLATRSTTHRQSHSSLDGRSIETAPKGLWKRENVINARKVQLSQIDNYEDNDDDSSNDDDDDDETCGDSSESSDAEHQSTPNLHAPYRIGLNSTGAHDRIGLNSTGAHDRIGLNSTGTHDRIGLNSAGSHSPKSKSPSQTSSYSAAQYSSKPSESTTSHQSSSYKYEKEKHPQVSQKYDVPSDNYASLKKSDDDSKGHGFMGSYDGYQGKATFFSQGGSAGACGKVHEDTDYVVAIQSQMYGGGKFCGKTIIVTRKSTGKSIQCIAADECPGCPTGQSLDLSIAAFNALGHPDEGVFDIHWKVMA